MTATPEIISKLLQDHTNMSRLLDLLERQLHALGNQKTEDLDLVQDIVIYCLGYPELSHRPQEDLIFRCLAPVDKSGTLKKVHAEHDELKRIGNQLSVLVNNISLDDQGTMNELTKLATRFIAVYREHMRVEEDVMFPLAIQHITQSQWSEIHNQIDTILDPVFGRTVDRRFDQLRQQILD